MPLRPTTLFNLLADETRLRSVLLLQAEGELCVCELTHALEMSQPKVSRHLGALRQHEVVVTRRQANWVYYRLSPDLPQWAASILATLLASHGDKAPCHEDRQRLAEMANRPEPACCPQD